MKNGILLAFLLLFSTRVFPSGFQINEHGARAMGMGGAFTGLADDPSALYYNPAGITQTHGTMIALGSTYIRPTSRFEFSGAQNDIKKHYFTPIDFYLTHQLTDRLFLGLSFNNPFGTGTEWDDSWAGRYRALKTEIQTYNLSPEVAYKLTENISLSLGFTASYSKVDISRKIPILVPTSPSTYMQLPDANIDMTGDDYSYGYNASAFIKATDDLSFGLAFKSPIKYAYTGNAALGDLASPALESKLPHGKIEAPIKMPSVTNFGAAYKFNRNFTLAADIQLTGWSSYDKLEVTFNEFTPAGTPYKSTSYRDFKNSLKGSIGGEYHFDSGSDLRAGVFYDQNPVKDERLDPTLPDADRTGISLGFGCKLTKSLRVDVSYLYLIFSDRKINNSEEFVPLPVQLYPLNGSYQSHASLLGVNFSLSL